MSITTLGMDTAIVVQHGENILQYELIDRGQYGHRLSVTTIRDSVVLRSTKTYIKHRVYRFCVCDINSDSIPDVCLGVVKATRFDPVVRRRLFIYTTDEGVISPLWMGSKVGHYMQDFTIIETDECTYIRTLEKHIDGSYSVGEYQWRSFGLIWKKYLKERINHEKALHIFHS